jgi:hypothetical protein
MLEAEYRNLFMSLEMNVPPSTSRAYQITVEGKIAENWSDWLSGMQIISRKQAAGVPITILCGVIVDQVALRGLLNRLWDLNLVLRSVQQLDPNEISNSE